jgi:rubrerythrin
MKLKTLDELGATNKEGCLRLLKEWNSGVYVNQVLETSVYWPTNHDRMSTLIARYHRFNDGIYNQKVDAYEKELERTLIDLAELKRDYVNNPAYIEMVEALANEKEYCRVFQNEFGYKVLDIIAMHYEDGFTLKAVELAERYDYTIYTCKSCASWHILKNEADPVCPDCEYSLDEVL